jgi:magnesium transporter
MSADATTEREEHLQHLRDALNSGTLRRAGRMINALHPAEIGRLLDSLPPRERNVVWDLVDPDLGGDVLLELNEEVRASLVRSMDVDEVVFAAEGMEVDDLADFLAGLPEAITAAVLTSLDHEDRERLHSVLAYPEDTAGGLMDTETVTVRPDVTLEVVLRYLRMRGTLPAGTDALFVVNRTEQYVGRLLLVSLLTEDPERTVSEFMDAHTDGIAADTSAAEVARLFEGRDLVSAPVVDAGGRLLGRITVDDVVDVIRDEADHSIYSMAGLDEDDDMFAPVITSSRRRAVWLGVNLATAFIAAWVVGLFEATLDQVVALAVLMPIVASMGGIAGSQTLTLIIRGLALGKVQDSNTRWLLVRELAVAMLNGLGWALVVALAVLAWFGDWRLGAIIGVALVLNLIVAAISGVLIPVLLKRLGIDPALAGSVVLTTVTDVVGFMAFLGLGTVFLT